MRHSRHIWWAGQGCAISASSRDSFALCSSHFPPVSDPRPRLHFNPPPAPPRPDRGAGVRRQRGSCPLWVAKRFTVWKIPIPCIISLTTSSASLWLCGNPFVPPSSRLAPPLPIFFPSVSDLSSYIYSVMSLFLLCLIPPTSEPFNSCSLVLRFSLPFFSVAKWKELLKTEKLYELKGKKNRHRGKKGIRTGLYLHEPTSFSCHVLAFARVYPSERCKRMFWSASRTISSLPYLAKWNCRLVQPAERESTAHCLSGRGLIPGLTSHSSKHCLSKATHANAACPLRRRSPLLCV